MTMLSDAPVVGGRAPSVIEERLRLVASARQELARLIIAHLPLNGEMRGNKTIRSKSRTLSARSDVDYLGARQELLDLGLIRLGHGRGGSLGLAEPFISDSEVGSEPPRSGLELSLYLAVKERLRRDFELEGRFDKDPVVEITGIQGRRKTGGKWTRPDITVVARKRFTVLTGAHLEVLTYEVKTGASLSIDALHEARAQRRRAHRAFVVVDLDSAEQADVVRGLVADAIDLGVGLISFMSVDDDWYEWVAAPFNQPDPIELDTFLETQLSDTAKQAIRNWSAVSALDRD